MASKRALITGITGQDGSYLSEWLLAQGYDAGRDETFLELRDAGTLDFTARIWTGQHVPLGFHGNFYAA